MACADRLVELLEADTLFNRWAQAEASFGSELVDDMRAFLQGHLPLLLTEADYARMDTLLTRQGIARARWRATTAGCCRPSAGSSTKPSTTTRWGCRSGHWENYRS